MMDPDASTVDLPLTPPSPTGATSLSQYFLQTVFGVHNANNGRGGDYIGGIDNEAIDFSQLEAFINSENPTGGGAYFSDSLNTAAAGVAGSSTPAIVQQPPSGGKLLNVIVDNGKRHALPDSPPDSSSEHPYSPSEDAAAAAAAAAAVAAASGVPPDNAIYTTLNPPYKQQLITETGLILDPPALLDYDKNLLLSYGTAPVTLDGGVPEDGGMVYTNLQSVAPSSEPATSGKKRKHSQENKSSSSSSSSSVKHEPKIAARELLDCGPSGEHSQLSPPIIEEEYAASECASDSQYQCIRFQPFQQPPWHVLCDQNLSELPTPHYRVDADKGFNFSHADDAFVCQKKNHFQITCHAQLVGDAQFVKTPEGFQKIASFHLHFYGVKHDCPTQTIRVEQSQSDRSKKPFHPVLVELLNSQVTKVTVGRLHFSETTSNNMRKKGKPNPEQRYFQLVVGLHAHTTHGNYAIVSHASQRIIVRASNPGQFESDVELCWQKGQTADSIYHSGRVGVNTDRPDESLVVHGNLKITGHIIQPSDVRAKKNIVECDSATQLRNVAKLRVVRYEYEPGFAAQLNRAGYCDTGVIAQEVAAVLPEAVRPAGDLLLANGVSIDNFLVVNKERIFMENVGAVKELCKVTDNLETRIDQLERMNKRLGKSSKGGGKAGATSGNGGRWWCSNKAIQMVIVVLVTVMALCLAAITALYFLETARHNQLTQASLQHVQHQQTRTLSTTNPPVKKRPTWQPVEHSTVIYRKPMATSLPPNYEFVKPMKVLGRPAECSNNPPALDEDLEHVAGKDPCQVYCCLPAKLDKLDSGELFDSAGTVKNKSDNLITVDKNRVLKAFHNNNIDKSRQKRDDEWTDRDNGYDAMIDELHFTVSIQGRHFNATLGENYLAPESSAYNYTYIIPVSKHMPDEYLTLVFHSPQAHLKDIENCYNAQRQHTCPWAPLSFERTPVNEAAPGSGASVLPQHGGRGEAGQLPTPQSPQATSVTFDVDLVGVHSKVMTYRASLKQNLNKCKLAATKLGIEFTEYNFLVYRHCDE